MLDSILSFDELLELSQRGDNSAIDMLVGDIYGGMDYSKVYFKLDLYSMCYWDILLAHTTGKTLRALSESRFLFREYISMSYFNFYNPLECLSIPLNLFRLVSLHQLLLLVLARLFQKTKSLRTTDLKIYPSLSCE
jgi:hypothetical protein